MTAFAMIIGAPEYFVLGMMALALISIASKGETFKGLIMGALGLLLGMIGADPVSGITYRFNFGLEPLEAGIEITLGALAIFALPQLIGMLEEGGTIAQQVAEIKDSVVGGVVLVLQRPMSVIRGGVIGWLIGVLPALGTSVAGITAYLVEKNVSKDKENFGKGSVDGLTAAEVGKGACILGDGITSLMLGVPGSVTWAILMAALIIHGVQPGPRLMTSGVLPYAIFAGLLLGQLTYFVIGIFFVKYMTKIVTVPNQILAPVIGILCFLGAYVAKNYVPDIAIMVILGIFAFGAQRNGYPTVPMILGFVLSKLIEGNFHRSLGVGFGSYSIFFTRPIALVMVVITAVFLAWPWILDAIRKRQEATGRTSEALNAITDKEKGQVTTGELLFGGIVILILLVFLVTSFSYSPDVRLFPVIVSSVGIVLTVLWIIGALRTSKITPFAFKGLKPDKGGLAWLATLVVLLAYVVLVPIVGFSAASAIFFVVVVVISGFRMVEGRWILVVATTIGIFAFLFLFAQLLQVELPVGLLGF
jgi:putative tricarboxylic transport membrane protein